MHRRPLRHTQGHWPLIACLWGLVLGLNAWAAEPKTPDPLLSLKRIYESGEFNSKGFSGRWIEGHTGYTTWESSDEVKGGRDLVLHHPETEATTLLIPAADLVPPGSDAPLSVSSLSWSKDHSKVLIFTNTKRVWRTRSRGDYWVLDRSSHELYQLGRDSRKPSLLQFAKFSPGGDKVAYVRENNLFVEDLHSREINALTTDGDQQIINGTFDWVYEEEFRLRDGFRWSPDGNSIAFWHLDTHGERLFPLVNNTDTLYPEVQWIQYPKVGEVNAACRIGVVDLASGQRRWLDLPGDPREHYVHSMEWPEFSDRILLQQLNRLQNTNRFFLAHTGDTSLLLTDTDEAWVESHPRVHLLPRDNAFLRMSERGGWQQVFKTTLNGKEDELVTTDDMDVLGIAHVDDAEGWLYFMASPDNPTQAYLYRSRLGRRKTERVTPKDLPGSHAYDISPDGKWAFHTLSRFGTPPRTELIRLPSHETVRVLEDNATLRDKLETLKPVETEMFRVDIGDGVELDAWCIRPADVGGERTHPLLIHVYGEPAGQTVQDRWGGGGYLWHVMLAQEGYVVMSFDNRGTPAPRGRAWRKSAYRKIGIVSPEDQAQAARAVLRERVYIDPERVGIWGWSGGGSSTLHAMFKYPDLYSMGIAIAAVPNQRYYDTIYQERYMGLPKDNVEGFREGSAINFAKHLKGQLLLIHGTGDDNVHYQGMEALVNELVRHGKPFRMMAYPNRSHSIGEGRGTTMHLRQLMLDFIHAWAGKKAE